MPIQLLPISLANQIAAGEVIERPASVVKELVENCLDAKATEITIDIEQGGRRRIRVRDNGTGIPKAELALALSRHATSKISSLADLEAIQSLGFRGEALASISSVSRLTLTAKTVVQEQAWQAWVEGRDMQAELAPATHPEGTTVDVQDLFFNTPARRKFLRTDKTEFNHIDEVLRRIALARFDVRFNLTHNRKPVRQYHAVSKPEQYQQRVAQVCGKAFTDAAVPIEQQAGPVQIWGWVAPAHGCRHQADVQYFYVNGRMMRDRLLGHAVRQAYGDSLGDDRVPTFVLYLQLPAQDVDVNVHPAKHEVRFHQARQIHDFVLQAVRQALQTATVPAVSDKPPAQPSAPTEAGTRHGYKPSHADLHAQVQELQPRHASVFPSRPASMQAPIPSATQQNSVLTVVQQRFALIAEPQLGLLDLQRVQHAYLLQQMQQQFTVGLAGQPLLVPVKISDAQLVKQLQNADEKWLAQLGVRLQRNNAPQSSVTVLEVPAALRQTDIVASLAKLIALQKQDSTTVLAWLAAFLVQTDYALTQAEHWWQWWREHAFDNAWLIPIQLPQLPEGLK